MRKTDINRLSDGRSGEQRQGGHDATSTLSTLLRLPLKILGTVFAVLAIAGIIVSVSLFSFIMSMRDESIKLDLNQLQLNYTSFIYVNDENGEPQEYMRLTGGEDRVWVAFDQIPDNMKNAIIAIEDKRFREHKGVDWRRTFGAVLTLFTQGSDYGGSTITQQLVKNLTGENEVSLTRKVKEIFRALNLEKKYSKDEILETYLNVVNFGSGCQGVQAAANLYFDKEIKDCTLAECAAIAGITQNPAAYTPLEHPQANKERQQTVLGEMYDQEMITEAEYNQAMAESENMNFVGYQTTEEAEETTNVSVWNWYIDDMFEDVVADLQESLKISEKEASNMMYHGGLTIYCAMDTQAQEIVDRAFSDPEVMPSDEDIEVGYFMMDYDGRVLATAGGKGEKQGNRLWSYATDTQRQPGSTIKPISVYAPAMEMGLINYSSLVLDEPVDDYFGPGRPGPNNWYRYFRGPIPVQYALEISANAPAVQLCKQIGPSTSYDFLTQQLGFTHLNPQTDRVELAAMAIGGMNGGVTVKEMTSAFQIFGNGGKYNEPYTYYYVVDHDGNVILDNRNKDSVTAISSTTSTIMQRILRTVIYGAEGTGGRAAISGWEVFGKTGTTDDDYDSWFIGGTPYAVAGIWTGYETPSRLGSTGDAARIWQYVMSEYLADKEVKQFTMDSEVISALYCTETGLLATGSCPTTKTGWYARDNMPAQCNGAHESESSVIPEESAPFEDPTIGESSVPESSGSGGLPPIYNPDNSSGVIITPPSSSSNSSSEEEPSSYPEYSEPEYSEPEYSEPSQEEPSVPEYSEPTVSEETPQEPDTGWDWIVPPGDTAQAYG